MFACRKYERMITSILMLVIWCFSKSAGAEGNISTGCFDKASIERGIRKHIAEIGSCYEEGLRINPNLYGKIVVSFVISGNHLVDKAEIKSSEMNSVMVEDCIIKIFEKMEFPESRDDNISVNYPLLFTSLVEETSEEDNQDDK